MQWENMLRSGLLIKGAVNMNDENLVLDVAEKYGFNLEFKTKNLFAKKGYSTEINKLYKYEEEYLEIDLLASKFDRVFVVECKGTASNSALILIKNHENDNFDTNIFTRRKIDNYIRIMGFGGTGCFCTFTGDFLYKEQKGFKKASKNDSENNFYKAQQQMTTALHAVATINNIKISDTSQQQIRHLMPLIVTNANIWVVDYEQNPVKATKHKWIKHKVISNTKLPLTIEDTPVHTYLCHVINIHHLDEFLHKAENMNRSTGTVDNLNNTLVEITNC